MGQKTCSTDQKKNIICLRDTAMFQHQISSQSNISCQYIRQSIGKFDKFHTVATKPGAGRTPKVTEHKKILIKLQEVLDDTLSLTDLVCFARTDWNLTIGGQPVSLILRDYDIVSYIASENLELLLHSDVLELTGVMNI